MRGVILPACPSRIKGQRSLVARLHRLILAANRYGTHRAATRDEQAFAGRLFNGLRQTLADITRLKDGP